MYHSDLLLKYIKHVFRKSLYLFYIFTFVYFNNKWYNLTMEVYTWTWDYVSYKVFNLYN